MVLYLTVENVGNDRSLKMLFLKKSWDKDGCFFQNFFKFTPFQPKEGMLQSEIIVQC